MRAALLRFAWAWMYLALVLLTSAAHIRAQSSVLPPVITSAPEDLKTLEGDGEQVQSVTDSTETTAEITTFHITEESTSDAAITPALFTPAGAVTSSTASESPVDTSTPLGSSTTQSSGHIVSSPLTSPSQDGTPSVLLSTTASAPATTGGAQGIAGHTHQDIPSQLNVGGEDFKGSGHSSLDPLLAGLLSVFIVTTAIIFVVLFLKFRHQNSNPEFHRLQDLPMDDLMEDTPLSRHSY